MITVYCTGKLAKLLTVKEKIASTSEDDWSGNLFSIDGRKCLIFAHKKTFYSFTILDVLKKDLKDFSSVFLNGLLKQLIQDGILSSAAEEMIKIKYEAVELSTTDNDKSTLGFMNDCVRRLKWIDENIDTLMKAAERYMANYYNSYPITKNSNTGAEMTMKAHLDKQLIEFQK